MKSKENLKPLFPSILAAVLVLGVFLIYLPVLLNLVNRLAGDEDYSYGLLLPLVSAYIVYLKWPQIRRYRWEPSWCRVSGRQPGKTWHYCRWRAGPGNHRPDR